MPAFSYPRADRDPVVEHLHGHPVPDPYRWLEDPSSAATARWTAAQDALWRRHRAALPDRDRFHARVTALSRPGTVSAPRWRGDRHFLLRGRGGAEHPVLLVVGPDGAEQVLLDPMALDPTGATTLDHWQPDLEGRLVACQLSRHGDERAELVVLDTTAGGAVVDGPIGGCRYSPVAWLPGGRAFYVVRSVAGAARRVYLHRVGTPAAADVPILGDGADPTVSYGLQTSGDGRWLAVSATRGTAPRNDLWLADLAGSPPHRPRLRPVQDGVPARTAAAVGPDGQLYVVTDLDAPRGRLCVADPAAPDPRSWRELFRAGPEEMIADVAVLDGAGLLVSTIRRGIGRIGVHEPGSGRWLRDVPLPGAGSVGSLAVRPEGGTEVWFGYTDSLTPGSVHRYDARTGQTTLWAAAPDAAPRAAATSREIGYRSADGTPVRMLVLAGPDPGAGPRPAILYGYGGFGIPLTPQYSGFALAWVEAGGVFATAAVRGGGEGGSDWHRAGMLAGKQNAIDDYLAAAERLIADGWTGPGRLAACGESGGGLLVGAAITQRPDLFAAAVCSAPLLDMVRYERSGMGAVWTGEYGTAEDPEQLAWLLGYSPYHHVHDGVDYPATLLAVFDRDTRVDPWHARKMCAALQWATGAPDRPIVLRRESGAGHGAAAAAHGIGLAADLLAFLAAHTGATTAHACGAAR